MIPILYNYEETEFTSNGMGRLRDCISCVVTEERNGIYECDFQYPVSGASFDKIQCGRVIGVTHDESEDIQPFDIVSYSRPINGVVTFHAVHISYRQSKMVTWASNINSLSSAFTALETIFYPSNPTGQGTSGNPFIYETDKTSTGYASAFDGKPRSIRSLLGGIEGSILYAYGGEYEWDKWTVKLHRQRGEQKDFSIRYGVNMTEFQDDTDYSESYNTCIPFWVSSDGTIIRGGEVSSGSSTAGAGNKCIPLDLTELFDSQPSVSALENKALEVMTSHQSFLPSQNIKLDFVRLNDFGEYAQFESLLDCKLCDSINVVFPYYNMSAYYKIVKTVWNVLLDRFDEMELGNLSTTLSEALGVTSGSSSYSGGGGGGGGSVYYGLRIIGHELTLVEGGSITSVTIPDNNTTYALSNTGTTITLTPSTGTAQSITVPVPTETSELVNDSNFISDANYVHTDNNFTTTEKNKLDGIQSGAEVNQNAFSNVKVGTTTIEADSKTDTLEFVAGSNITITPSASNDRITISASGGGGGSGTSVPTADTVAEFDSTAHMNSTDMTSQEVDDFVDALDPQAGGVADYVIEQGTDGIWNYRKWDSGKYEAWAFSSTSATHYVTFAGWYGYYVDLALPSFMLTKDNLFITCPLASGTQFCMPTGYVISSSGLRAYCCSAGSGTQTIMFNLLMIGRWK